MTEQGRRVQCRLAVLRAGNRGGGGRGPIVPEKAALSTERFCTLNSTAQMRIISGSVGFWAVQFTCTYTSYPRDYGSRSAYRQDTETGLVSTV